MIKALEEFFGLLVEKERAKGFSRTMNFKISLAAPTVASQAYDPRRVIQVKSCYTFDVLLHSKALT